MTTYRYLFERVDEELRADLRLDHPIPHLEVGNSLVLLNEHLALRSGHHFVIRHVETYVPGPRRSVDEEITATIYIEQRDRAQSPVQGSPATLDRLQRVKERTD